MTDYKFSDSHRLPPNYGRSSRFCRPKEIVENIIKYIPTVLTGKNRNFYIVGNKNWAADIVQSFGDNIEQVGFMSANLKFTPKANYLESLIDTFDVFIKDVANNCLKINLIFNLLFFFGSYFFSFSIDSIKQMEELFQVVYLT
ncbi:MAG: hypothetical protein Q4Q22_08735 [Methanosphaera sp.]|nr:hypothetical protein [Methanosphaera sp.]